MTLQVVTVPTPAAGTDWRYTVPAQWVLDVVAVQASLTTLANPTIAADSSGNGRDALYDNSADVQYGTDGPYTGGALDNAVQANLTNTGLRRIAQRAQDTAWDTATMTAEFWAWKAAISAATDRALALDTNSGGTPLERWCLRGSSGGVNWSLILTNGLSVTQWTVPIGAVTTWNHIAVTWDGANWNVYKDGVNIATPAGTGPVLANTNNFLGIGGRANPAPPGINGWKGRLAGCAIYGAALPAANIAAHAAAFASNAAYKAAVLADTPLGLWMLDEVQVHGARQSVLEITDGTTALADYPGLANSSTGAAFTWCWTSNASSSVLSTDGTVNYVPIPDTVLPAGYTIGTNTPGLSSQDQWSNIKIWWDDARSTVAGARGSFQSPYLNALLVPDYSHRGV